MGIHQRQEDLISVIVPAYNEANYIESCLVSLRQQDYANLEIIVVDDGSTDETPELVRNAAEKDSRVKVIRQENGGLSAARNMGLDHASGSLVMFVDSDDLISSQHITRLREALHEQGADVAVTNLTTFGDVEGPSRIVDSFGRPTSYSSLEAVREVFYQGVFDTCAQAKLYRASLWEGIRFPLGYVHEDIPTIYQVLLRAGTISFVSSASYGYRYSRDGLNRSRTTDGKARVAWLLERQLKDLTAEHPELVPAARCFLVSLCFHLYLGGDSGSMSTKCANKLKALVRKYRASIIRDVYARRKTRIACAISCLGFPAVRAAFRCAEGMRKK